MLDPRNQARSLEHARVRERRWTLGAGVLLAATTTLFALLLIGTLALAFTPPLQWFPVQYYRPVVHVEDGAARVIDVPPDKIPNLPFNSPISAFSTEVRVLRAIPQRPSGRRRDPTHRSYHPDLNKPSDEAIAKAGPDIAVEVELTSARKSISNGQISTIVSEWPKVQKFPAHVNEHLRIERRLLDDATAQAILRCIADDMQPRGYPAGVVEAVAAGGKKPPPLPVLYDAERRDDLWLGLSFALFLSLISMLLVPLLLRTRSPGPQLDTP